MSVGDEVMVRAQEALSTQGLPWSSIGDYFTGDLAWREILLDRQMQGIAAISHTNITIDEVYALDEQNALDSVVDIWARVLPLGGTVLDLLNKGEFTLFQLKLPQDYVRQAIIAVYTYNRIGTNLHFEGAFARGIDEGRISMRDAEEHLDRCVKIWETLGSLDEKGILTKLVPARGTSGVGVAPVIPIGVIVLIVLVAAVAVIGYLGIFYLIGTLMNQRAIQKRAFDQCDELLKREEYAEADKCRAAALQSANESSQNAIDKIMEPLTFAAWALGIGAVVWIGVTFVLPVMKVMKPASGGASA